VKNLQGVKMSEQGSALSILPCLDSVEMSEARRRDLDIPRNVAAALGRSAVEAAGNGHYFNRAGKKVDWSSFVNAACSSKRSLAPEVPLPMPQRTPVPETRVQVTNETTLGASFRLVESGLRPVALNFANGIHPGGGFLSGARAQEEVLCRSSALYQTLVNAPMYQEHRKRERPDSTDWAICSPDVPVFRKDDGTEIDHPWLLSFITCAAPYAPAIGQPESGDLLQKRIHRVLSIAKASGYSVLSVHGAAVLLPMTLTAQLSISATLSRTISSGHSPTSCSPSQIGLPREDFSARSEMFLLRRRSKRSSYNCYFERGVTLSITA
jgi:uncharacterized protein (TIGR02452 family)